MLSRLFNLKRHNTHPTVTKVSDIIDTRSHKQKKYISLMFVPSYTNGKTRSLRVPRGVFYFIIISMFAVSAVIAGLTLRSNYFMAMAQDYSAELERVNEEFMAHIFESEAELDFWMEANTGIAAMLTDEQIRAQREEIRLRQIHQGSLDDLQGQLLELERQVRAFDKEIQAAIEGMAARAFIPPVGDLLDRLHTTQAVLLAESIFHAAADDMWIYDTAVPLTAFSSGQVTGLSVIHSDANPIPLGLVTEAELHSQIEALTQELALQLALLENMQSYRAQMERYLTNYPTLWPVNGRISSGFGYRSDPFTGQRRFHHGIDIPAPIGTPIRAAGGGTVIFHGWQSSFGNIIIIDHGFGLTTVYAHNNRNLVRVGQTVERGQIIAHVGATGRATGPHLHFEVRRNNVAINPRPFLLES